MTYQWERFSTLQQELLPLFKLHWLELAVNKRRVPLDPNFAMYNGLEQLGTLFVLTVRANGRLVGYLFALVGPHLHYASTVYCHVDMFWLASEYRHGWAGVRIFRELEAKARDLGAALICVGEKLHFKNKRGKRVSRLFRRQGFKPVERVYHKLLT